MKHLLNLLIKAGLISTIFNLISHKPAFAKCIKYGNLDVCRNLSSGDYTIEGPEWSISGNCKKDKPNKLIIKGNSPSTDSTLQAWHDISCSESFLIKAKKQTAEEYMQKGINKLNFEDYGQAFEYFNKAIDSDPEFYDVYPPMIWANIFDLMDYEEAIQNLNLLIGNESKLNNNVENTGSYLINGNKFFTYYLRGFSKSELQDYESAIADYKKVIDHYRNLSNVPLGWTQNTNILAQSYYGIGVAKFNMMDFSGAIDSFSEAIKIDPNYSQAYYARGFAKLEKKDIDGGCSDSEIAFKKGYKAIGLDSLGEIGVNLCF